MPQEELGPLMDAVEHLAPVHILKNEVFPELDSMFHISELDPSEKEAALKGDYAVIIEIPENFTYDLLRNVILNEGDIGTITLYEKHERSEEHTSELQSRGQLVCRLLLEKKKDTRNETTKT